MTFPHLKILPVFRLFLIITIGKISQIRASAVEIDHRDGEKFVNRIVHGEKLTMKPGYFLFTAPYRLCEGGCNNNDGDNFAMVFPLYVGKKGKEKYKNIYKRDFKKLHSNKPNAPFKKKTTIHQYTPCPTSTTTTIKTTTTATTVETTTTTMITTDKTTPKTPKSTTITTTVTPTTTLISNTTSTTTKPKLFTIIILPITILNHSIFSKSYIISTTVTPDDLFKASFIHETTESRVIDEVMKTPTNYDLESAMTSEEKKIEYSNHFYELATKKKVYSDDYITNAKGVRCPKLTKCKNKATTHVTPDATANQRNSEKYEKKKSSSFGYDTKEAEFK